MASLAAAAAATQEGTSNVSASTRRRLAFRPDPVGSTTITLQAQDPWATTITTTTTTITTTTTTLYTH